MMNDRKFSTCLAFPQCELHDPTFQLETSEIVTCGMLDVEQ